MAFEEHIWCWHIYGYSMENKSCILVFFTYMCSNVGQHVDYIIRSHDQKPRKSCYILFQSCWAKECNGDSKKCHWHHVMLMLAPMVAYDQKGHVAHNFNYLDLRNAMVPLTKLLASCDVKTNYSDVSDQGSRVAPHLDHHWPKDCNDAIDDTISIMWHWCQEQWQHWPRKSYFTSF